MKKCSSLRESKRFIADPTIIKRYASFIIPLYITGELNCPKNLLDEYFDLHKSNQHFKSYNVVCDLEVMAIKNIHSNPLTEQGFNQLKSDIANDSIKLEKFLRPFIRKTKNFQ